jgi:hypothetical protein
LPTSKSARVLAAILLALCPRMIVSLVRDKLAQLPDL